MVYFCLDLSLPLCAMRLPLLPTSCVISLVRPGSLVVREGGGREPSCPLLVAFEDGISLYDPCSGKRVPAAEPGAIDDYEQLPNTRMNDGRWACALCAVLRRNGNIRSCVIWRFAMALFADGESYVLCSFCVRSAAIIPCRIVRIVTALEHLRRMFFFNTYIYTYMYVCVYIHVYYI